jgi:hypothetical protein
VRSFYASVSGYRDELLWAALWLHRATGRAEYLRYAVDRAESFGGVGWAMTEFSWDVKYAGVQVLAAKVRTPARRRFDRSLFFSFCLRSIPFFPFENGSRPSVSARVVRSCIP